MTHIQDIDKRVKVDCDTQATEVFEFIQTLSSDVLTAFIKSTKFQTVR